MAPFSYFNVVSSDPPLVSVSIERMMGKQKHTSKNIIRQKDFVIHVVDHNNVEKNNIASANLLADESEIDYAI